MKSFRNNNILKKGILGFLLLFVLLAPVSIPFVQISQHTSYISMQLAFAEETSVVGGIVDVAGGALNWMLRPAANFFGNIILSTAAAVTYFGGTLLDLSLDQMVFKMGEKINNESFGNAIDSMWRLIRDICNLAFIFGFIYIGIKTIIDPESASTKRFLSKIIIGALLINFSLFFVKIIIDFSNFTALQIYNAMTPNATISQAVTQLLGVVTIYSAKSSVVEKLIGDTSIWFYIFGAIFLVITGFTFIAAAALLITRFVALILIMVCSPILFAATIFPQTEQYASDLWKKLIGYSFFAPIYLLLVLISLTLLNGLNMKPAGGAFTDMLTPQTGSATMVILNFIITIFFMIAALNIANKLGIAGGNMVVSKTKTLIGGATAGATAWAGRNTVGRYALSRSQDEDLRDRASQSGVRGFIARRQLAASTGLANATFDARNVNGVGKTMKIGDGGTEGYGKRLEKKIKAEQAYAEGLGYDANRVHSATHAGEERIHHSEAVVKAEKEALLTTTKSLREELRNETRRSNDSTLSAAERKESQTKARKLRDEIQDKTAEHKAKIESAEADVALAKKTMEDSIKSIKGERKKNYADSLEETANLFSIRGFDLAPSNREAAEILRDHKHLNEMFRGIKEQAKSQGGGDHGHGGGDHGGGHGKKDNHGHGGGDHGGGHGKKDDHGHGGGGHGHH